ncbi:hypothetical protein [Mesorhizobium sp.]|nr:hypothetical protein [Mesorhizobium sp.]
MSTNDLGTTELQEAAERKHTAVEAKSEDEAYRLNHGKPGSDRAGL